MLTAPTMVAPPRSLRSLSPRAQEVGDLQPNWAFTPAMSKRIGHGPFDVAVICQGDWAATQQQDEIQYSTGAEIGLQFHPGLDVRQLSIAFWITPEWDGNDNKSYTIYKCGAGLYVWKDGSTNEITISVRDGGGTWRNCGRSTAAWTAGSTYFVVGSCDSDNATLNGNHMRMSVDDAHTYDEPAWVGTVWNVGANARVGAADFADQPANAIIEGLTIYRRCLWDGAFGVTVGNGDEINLMYAAGAGQDPCLITGAWDIVFCMPTDQTVPDTIVTGTGEAWQMPHSSNVITPVDGFALTATYAASAWTTLGAPTIAPRVIAVAANKVYQGGFEFQSNGVGDGIQYRLAGLTPGDDYVLRIIAHTGNANGIDLSVWDVTNGAWITQQYIFGATSTPSNPGLALISFELPAACVSIDIRIMAMAGGVFYRMHQAELYDNWMNDPSMENGAGNPWLPAGWAHIAMDPGDSQSSAAGGAVIHSGTDCIQFNVAFVPNEEAYYRKVGIAGSGRYCALGAWIYGDGTTGVSIRADGELHYNTNGSLTPLSIPANWNHLKGVYRRASAATNAINMYLRAGAGAVGNRYADDVYMLELDDVSLTVTACTEADSVEGPNTIRVDGRDDVSHDIITGHFGPHEGWCRFKWISRHGGGDFLKFADNTATAVIVQFNFDINHYIRLRVVSDTQIRLLIDVGGGALNNTWIPGAAIAAGTEYFVEIFYNSQGIHVSFDGVIRLSIAVAIDFGAFIPNVALLGNRATGDRQIDAVYKHAQAS